MLVGMLHDMEFKSTLADPDAWIWPAVKTGINEKYYEYISVYVNDILVSLDKP